MSASPDAPLSPAERAESFREALADDFNTPRAMAEIFELVGDVNRGRVPAAAAVPVLTELLRLVGLDSLTREKVVEGEASAEIGLTVEARGEAEALLAEREVARAAKDFARADEIRDRLAEMGWEVRDGAEGARLVPKT